MSITSNVVLTNIFLPALNSVTAFLGYGFFIDANAALTSLTLPSLNRVLYGPFRVTNNPNLVSINCSSFGFAKSFFVSRTKIAEFDLNGAKAFSLLDLCDPGLGANATFLATQAVICFPCAPGFYSQTQSLAPCLGCPAGLGSTEGADRCVQCGAGSYSLGSSPCTSCPAGQYSSSVGSTTNTCAKCPAGTYANATGASGCTSCPLGSILPGSGATSNTCQPCVAGTFAASGSTCALCPAGSISSTGSIACSYCDVGQIAVNGTVCQNCSAGTFAPFGAGRCFDCGPGTWSGLASGSCSFCPAGTASALSKAISSLTCLGCPAGSFSQIGSASCTPCAAGTNSSIVNATSNSCAPCGFGFYSSPGSSVCTQCPSGTFTTSSSAPSCQSCAQGTVPQGGGCAVCPAGTFAPYGAANCTSCSPGSYSGANAGSCSFCPAGTASSVSSANSSLTCLGCPAGFFSQIGSASCTPCAAGTNSSIVNATSNSCAPCGFGFYSPPGSSVCTECTSGTFTRSAQAASCEACLPGTIPNGSGCVNCTAGTYAPFGASSCVACPPGTWSTIAADRCVLCPMGTYSSVSGASNGSFCLDCPAGSYAVSPGSSACLLCEPGTSSSATRASTFATCLDCPAGTFSSTPGAASCSNCTAGFISTDRKSVSCVPCPPGRYQPIGGQTTCLCCPNGTTIEFSGKSSCATCLPGAFPLTSSSGCVDCPRGFASPDGRSCNECRGQFFASSSGLSACEQCPIGQTAQSSWGPCVPCTQNGYYVDLVLGCQPCPNGTFLNANSGVCVSCPAGYWSGEASTLCYPCQKGFERPGSSVSGCRPCTSGFVAPTEGTPTCSQCGRGLFVVNSSVACHPCSRGTFANTAGAVSCAGCPSNRLCPLATSIPVDSSQIPFFTGLVFARFGISSGITAPSFNSNSLVPQNFWTTSNGIAAIVILCLLLVLIPCALAVIYFGCRLSKSAAQFETWKVRVANLDFLYASSHKSGSLPRVVIERKTVFGALMSICAMVACAVLLTFLVLNWYYSPALSSSLVPFGYVGEPDPVAGLRLQMDLWGWSGPCALPFGSACAMSFAVDGIGQTNGSQLLVSCSNRSFSCFVDISASAAVLSSFGSIRMTTPQGGNAMGVTYRASLTPSLNDSITIAPFDVSETIFAGSSEVFGGSDPVVVSLSTKWANFRDETQGTARKGWIVGSAGLSPGSNLNNVTFLDPARDKQFRLSITLARGTEFLAITVSYSSSIAILIGSIIGYLLGVVVLVRFIMRCFEWVHQLHHDAPTVVTEYLASLAPPSLANFDDQHKSMLAASDTLGHFDSSFEKQSYPIRDEHGMELETIPQATKISNYDAHRMSSL